MNTYACPPARPGGSRNEVKSRIAVQGMLVSTRLIEPVSLVAADQLSWSLFLRCDAKLELHSVSQGWLAVAETVGYR